MKEFEEKELQLIEKCGRCLFKVDELAIILEIDAKDIQKLLADSNSTVFKRFNKGRFLGELEVRESMVSMAAQGSVQSQTLYLKLRDELKVSEA